MHSDLRVIPPEKMHVTVLFFGNVVEEHAAQLIDLTNRVKWRRLEVETGKLSVFNQGALVIRLNSDTRDLEEQLNLPNSSLGRMAAIRRELDKERNRPDRDRELELHVTLGRLRERRKLNAVANPLQMRFELEGLVLYESVLSRDGSQYRELGRSYGR